MLASTGQREGGGASSPDGRYYYHGDSNISSPALHKLDTIGDSFQQITATSTNSSGRIVVVSEDGGRVFYAGTAFDADLQIDWQIGAPIYSTSEDGRFAFGETAIYDIDQQRLAKDMPVSTKISAFNPATNRLIVYAGNSFEYFSLTDLGLVTSEVGTPNATSIHAPEYLAWDGLPGATGYRVYLGTSEDAVANAGPGSPEYLGQVTGTELVLEDPLPAGTTYYWRIEYVFDDVLGEGPLQNFHVVTVAPATQLLTVSTVQGDIDHAFAIPLSSAVDGEAWTAHSANDWIALDASSGSTPGTLTGSIDIASLPAGISTGTITVSGGGQSVEIQVAVEIDPLALTRLESDPDSTLIYGLSEKTTPEKSYAYLLEIDSQTESIIRAVRVGTGATDLAVHTGDNRVYVTNWRAGQLYAVNRDTFEVDDILRVPPFSGTGYSDNDVYVISAGGPGRLVVEGEDQWIDVSILNTANGQIIASTGEREGGGAHSPSKRYYYHGDNNSSGAEIHKFDTIGDTFAELASVRVATYSYYGSRVVTISGDGDRVYWNGTVFDANLSPLWSFSKEVHSTTHDGRFGFGLDSIFDTTSRQIALGMPVSTTVSAYNHASDKLLVQKDGQLEFHTFNNGTNLVAPLLSAGAVTSSNATLTWVDRSLETGFTLQRRVLGTTDWTDVSATLAQNSTAHQDTGLTGGRTYEFRLQANATTISSAWSNIVTLTTPLPVPVWSSSQPTIGSTQVTLSWSITGTGHAGLLIERSIEGTDEWETVATLPLGQSSWQDTGLTPATDYLYRIKTTDGELVSGSSAEISVTTNDLISALPPTSLTAASAGPTTTTLRWTRTTTATGYRIERTPTGESNWLQIASVSGSTTSYRVLGLQTGVTYDYRLRSYNADSVSDYSDTVSATPGFIGTPFSENFEHGLGQGWTFMAGGQPIYQGMGNTVLWFGLSSLRNIQTVPLELTNTGIIRFDFRAGNTAYDGPMYWENSDINENVVLEYSTNGYTWNLLQIIDSVYPAAADWATYTYALPPQARSKSTSFRWRQLSHNGYYNDQWALDNITITQELLVPTAPDFITVSTIADSKVAISWNGAVNAEQYQVERSLDGLIWTPIALRPAYSPYYTDTDCIADTWYGYRVISVNGHQESTPSDSAWAKTYDQMFFWRLANYGVVTPTGDAAPLARDSHRLTNLEKFGFGLSVSAPPATHVVGSDQPGLPKIWLDQTTRRLRVEFLRRKPATNPKLRYEIEYSSDLINWTPGGTMIDQTSVDNLWERVCIEDSASTTGQKQRFVRVKLVQE
ncbi:MAG: fibronectin type III domain-containing protein [Verrucomicrobiota bacterium]